MQLGRPDMGVSKASCDHCTPKNPVHPRTTLGLRSGVGKASIYRDLVGLRDRARMQMCAPRALKGRWDTSAP